jgi:hypothetical protein
MTLFLRNGKCMKTAIMFVVMLVLGSSPFYSAADEQPPPIPSQEQPEVLTRGPVHEAFAEPVNLQVQAGLVAPKPPPANIAEVAPAQRPAGEQFVLVPGYWSWDTDRNDYIWVSACWRAAPPNMSWVPGYWSQVTGGWEWVAGFWTPAGIQNIEYLPAPPALEYVQPLGPPPSEDQIWVPSCQYWYQGRYVMRTGYWLIARPGWVWVPSHYIWTPRGYVFSPGHWDYSLERRGVLFAPVYFPRPVYVRAGFFYSPSIVIDIGILQLNLFTCPRYSHYYFGDYYDDVYLRVGIFPRFQSERSRIWYDPLYVYDRWHNRRTEPRWEEHERHEYNIRRADRNLRPPRTYREMQTRQAMMPEQQRGSIRMARPMTDVVASKATMRFEQIDAKKQKKITAQATEVSKFREERSRLESPAIGQKSTQPITEHKSTVTTPAERKQPLQPVTEQRKGMVTPPTERKEPVAPVKEQRKDTVTPSAEQNPVFVSPREVRAAKAEKVKISKPPIVGKQVSGKTEVALPPNPAEERKQIDTKDKDKGRDKNKAK